MKFKYTVNNVKDIYKVVFIDRNDLTDSTTIEAYSEKQAIYLFKKNHKNGERIIDMFKVGSLPDTQGNQVYMDF